jgi:hypothetical protein
LAIGGILSYATFLGVLPSAAFIIWQVGRYATPQVPRTLFDERKEVFSYTAGLFAGIGLAILFLLLAASLFAGGWVGTVISLVALVAGIELTQWLLARSVYFGSDGSLPFYVLGARVGIGGLLGIAVVGQYLAGVRTTVLGAFGVLLEAVAFTILLAAAGIQSTPTGPPGARRPGALAPAVLLELLGFLLVGLGPLGGEAGVLVAAVAVAGGSAGLYLRRRDDVLGRVRAPKPADGTGEEPTAPGPFARRDR